MAVVGDAYIVVHAITKNYEKEMQASAKQFNSLIKKGYAVGPAVSGAASAISDLVAGLFAVGSAVGAAAPALAVLPSAFAAIIQGALTAKMAFSGVGKAIAALGQQEKEAADNSKAIEDARRRLALVYQKNAENIAAANDKVRDAQIELNAAYIEGAEALQQLAFQAEDAALSQDKAAIALERARETLLRSQDLPENDRGRRDAVIAFREAELNYRKSLDSVNDLQKQQEYAATTGIEGTKEVLDAKNKLAEAEDARAKQERDNAQAIAEAQRQLAAALSKSSAASKAVQDAMKDLSPEAQKFAKFMAALKPVLVDLRQAAGKQLFGPLQEGIQLIVDKLVPVLKPMLEAMGGVVGTVLKSFMQMVTSVKNLEIINRVFGKANLVIFAKLGGAFVDLADAFLSILDAVAPLTIKFSNYVAKLAEAAKFSMAVQNSTGLLGEKFNKAGSIVGSIGALLKSTYSAFRELGGAASEAGVKIIKYFTGSMDRLKEFAIAGKRTGELQAQFDRIADNFIATGKLLGAFAAAFFSLAGNPGVKLFAEALMPLPKILADIASHLTSTGPMLADFIVKFVNLLKVFTETGGVENFFKVLTGALDVVVSIFSNTVVQNVFQFMAKIHGLTLAIGVLALAAKKLGLVFLAKALFPIHKFAALARMVGINTTSMKGYTLSVEALTRQQVLNNMAVRRGIATGLADHLASMRIATRQYIAVLVDRMRATLENIAVDRGLTKAQLQTRLSAMQAAGAQGIFTRTLNAGKAGVVGFAKFLLAPIIAMKKFTQQVWLNTIALYANPITGPLALIITAVVIAVAALVAIFIKVYQASQPLQDAIEGMANAIGGVLMDGVNLIMKQFNRFAPELENIGDVFKQVGDFIAKWLIPPIQWLVTSVLKVWIGEIVMLIGILIGVVKGLVAAFRFVWDILWAIITLDFQGITDAVKNFGSAAMDAFGAMFGGIIDGLDFIIPFKDALSDTEGEAKKLTKAEKEHAATMKKINKEWKTAIKGSKDLYKAYGDLAGVQKAVNGLAADEFDFATEKARAYIDQIDAVNTLAESTKTLKTELKTTNTDIANQQAMGAFATAYLDAASGAIAAGKSHKEAAAIIDQGRASFIIGAEKIGLVGKKAEEMADYLGLTPDVINKTFVVSGIDKMQALIDKIKDYKALLADPNAFRLPSGKDLSFTMNTELKMGQTKTEAELKRLIDKLNKEKFGRGQTAKDPLYVSVQEDVTKGKQGPNALGGDVVRGGSYLVGEQGPEIFEPSTSGKVRTNADTSQLLGGSNATINMNVYASNGMDERELASIASRNIAWSLKRGG